jgi:deazaflavin-dependent oxidoreductase (nitroreductase family)
MSIGLKLLSALHTGLYRLTAGRVGGSMVGAKILLLTTVGSKTGKRRTAPVIYGTQGDRVVIIASKSGAPEHPAWYKNLQKNPEVEVEMGKEKRSYRARTATAAERTELWTMMTGVYSGYDGYQKKTSREIPVVVLEPAKS